MIIIFVVIIQTWFIRIDYGSQLLPLFIRGASRISHTAIRATYRFNDSTLIL